MWIRVGVILNVVVFVFSDYDADNPILQPILSGAFRVNTIDSYPWHAGLYTKTTKPYKQICGGTIVSKRAVITAAHCFTMNRHVPSVSLYAVAAGKVYRPWNDPHDTAAQKSNVSDIKIPQHYQGSSANFQDDIAVVILAKDLVMNLYVATACVNFNPELEAAQLKEGQLGNIVGWGLTGENSPSSQVLQGATLPIISIDKCIEQSPVGFRSSITGDKICAGYNNGTAVCRGDSGGGLIFQANWQFLPIPFLRGVVSTSPTSENMCNIHTWATFTNVQKHERFLKSVLPDIENACELPTSSGFTQFDFSGTDQEADNYLCSCKCTRRHELEYHGKLFPVNFKIN